MQLHVGRQTSSISIYVILADAEGCAQNEGGSWADVGQVSLIIRPPLCLQQTPPQLARHAHLPCCADAAAAVLVAFGRRPRRLSVGVVDGARPLLAAFIWEHKVLPGCRMTVTLVFTQHRRETLYVQRKDGALLF